MSLFIVPLVALGSVRWQQILIQLVWPGSSMSSVNPLHRKRPLKLANSTSSALLAAIRIVEGSRHNLDHQNDPRKGRHY